MGWDRKRGCKRNRGGWKRVGLMEGGTLLVPNPSDRVTGGGGLPVCVCVSVCVCVRLQANESRALGTGVHLFHSCPDR